ncbi:MAG: cysteine-rich CWC family protein [Burkholderiales bacterium]|nr:cysteine-rich CWC family protein [Burkholderiales bacterium]
MTPVVLASSGGKDSVLALAALRAAGTYEVRTLLSTVNEDDGTLVMHGVPLALLEQQASSLGVPLVTVRVPRRPTDGVYESRMADALARFKADDIATAAFGDLHLEDVRAYRDAMLARAGFTGVYPLWGRDTRALAVEFRRSGYRAVTVCVDRQQLPGAFAGRELDQSFFGDLPATADPCGENGEYHSFVYDGPGFAFPIRFARRPLPPGERFHYCALEPARASVCARCGALFDCGMEAGLGACWCAGFPLIAPTDPASGCYCPRCLAEVSREPRGS